MRSRQECRPGERYQEGESSDLSSRDKVDDGSYGPGHVAWEPRGNLELFLDLKSYQEQCGGPGIL